MSITFKSSTDGTSADLLIGSTKVAEVNLTGPTESVASLAKVASQALTDAGTDDVTMITPKKMRWGVQWLKSTNGYVVFPTWLGGFIIQWGLSPVIASNNGAGTFFPIPFPSACYSASVLYAGAGPSGSPFGITDKQKTYITIQNSGPGAAQYYYIAIGV